MPPDGSDGSIWLRWLQINPDGSAGFVWLQVSPDAFREALGDAQESLKRPEGLSPDTRTVRHVVIFKKTTQHSN
jgi:hypothetical protein